MKLLRIIVSDLHLGAGSRRGELNPLEDFFQDEKFGEMLRHYNALGGSDTEIELVLNGDIFDLLKIKVAGAWPTEITEEVAIEKLHQCLDGHPVFVRALRDFLQGPSRRATYLPGNHDLDMWFPAAQELLRRHIAPADDPERLRFVCQTDTYYLPEGIQIRHGHQLERIHRVDYERMTRKRRDGEEILDLPWGSLWTLEVLNPAKEARPHIDRIQPLRRFILSALLFDTRFALRFVFQSAFYFLRRRVFAIQAWRRRIAQLPRLLREEVVALGGFDETATRELRRMRGVHTLIVGHSHGPRYRAVPEGKTLVNTGTWMPMINLDLQYLGRDSGLTYAIIEYDPDGRPRTSLMRWHGSRLPCEAIPWAY